MWILAEINFSGASEFFPDPSFGPPGNEIRGPKLSANCPQIVRKVSADFQNSPNRDSTSCEFERLKNELKNGSFQAGKRVFFAVFCRARKTAVFLTKKRDFPLENCRFLARFLDVQIRRILSHDLANFGHLRTVAGNLRTVCGQFRAPNFVSRGSERGVGEKFRGLQEMKLGQNQHCRPTFFGVRYQQKAVGSDANLLQSGAREIIMVTKELLKR